MNWFVVSLIIASAPIWRNARHLDGISLWTLMSDAADPEYISHIPVDEAVQKAQEAYREAILR